MCDMTRTVSRPAPGPASFLDMADARRSDQCIERRGFGGTNCFYSVFEYEEGMERAKFFAYPRGLSFHGLIWTHGAPRPEDLTADWTHTRDGGDFRICDREVYDAQMRRMLGLD